MRAHWQKVAPTPMSRLMSTNGAHRDPKRYVLMSDNGEVLATVQETAGQWRWWLAGAPKQSGPFASAETAKAAARSAALANVG